jgi:hypothetical protein
MKPSQFAVLVPLEAVRTLQKANPVFEKSAGQQTLPSEVQGHRVVESVEPFGGLGLSVNVENLPRPHLHPKGQLKALDARLQLRVRFI